MVSLSFPETKKWWKQNRTRSAEESLLALKKGIFLYFLLLIFEGALRKWFLTPLATPLLIIRDPVALWILIGAARRGLFPRDFYLSVMKMLVLVSIFTAVFAGHGNLPVALYGARIFLLHFPLIFVIGKIFSRDDVLMIGKCILWISIPMTILIAMQFYSPQIAWVNRGLGGDMAGAGFDGAMGYFRPPGTFSFTTGNAEFYSLVACFVFYFWLEPGNVNRYLLIGATAALLIAIPLSISRGLFFQIGLTLLFALLAILRKPKFLSRMLMAILGGIIALALLSRTSFFQTATEAFTSRFETAGEQEGGLQGTLGDRYLGGLVSAVTESSELPFWGQGMGMGTNVGSMLLSGDRTFLIAEGEWGRLIGELGPLMGFIVILLRLGLGVRLASASYQRLVKGDILPWLLLSFAFLIIAQAQWAQPTSLGFSTLTGGLLMAAAGFKKKEESNS
jgi:hypothetical protein